MKRYTRASRATLLVAITALVFAGLAAGCSGAASPSAAPASAAPATETPASAAPATQAPTVAPSATAQEGVTADLVADETTMVDTTKYKKDKPWTIALLWQGPINGWGTVLGTTAQWMADQDGAKLISMSAEANSEKQISQMEDVIKLKPDVIILEPMSAAALVDPTKRAMEAGIPVVSCADGIEGKPYVTYSDVDLYKTGYLAAKSVAEALNGTGNVMLINGIPGVDAAEKWKQAAHDLFAQYPNIKIVGEEYGNWSISTSKDKAAALLAANPKVDGVWAGGSEGAIGALLAIKDAGAAQPVYGTISPLNGFFRLAIENNIKFTAYPQSPTNEAQYCYNAAKKILQGEQVARFVHQPDGPFTEADAQSQYVPELNDDWSGPINDIPIDVFYKAGFKRQ